MRIEKIEKDNWKKFSESAHLICFKENRAHSLDRIDFALLAINDIDIPCGYVTCRETDSETLYWAFGGAFPSVKGTINSYRCYEDFIKWTAARYKRVYTLIENTNSPMLRMAAHVGFFVVGIKNFHGQVLLEHMMEFENGDN